MRSAAKIPVRMTDTNGKMQTVMMNRETLEEVKGQIKSELIKESVEVDVEQLRKQSPFVYLGECEGANGERLTIVNQRDPGNGSALLKSAGIELPSLEEDADRKMQWGSLHLDLLEVRSLEDFINAAYLDYYRRYLPHWTAAIKEWRRNTPGDYWRHPPIDIPLPTEDPPPPIDHEDAGEILPSPPDPDPPKMRFRRKDREKENETGQAPETKETPQQRLDRLRMGLRKHDHSDEDFVNSYDPLGGNK